MNSRTVAEKYSDIELMHLNRHYSREFLQQRGEHAFTRRQQPGIPSGPKLKEQS